MKPRLSIHLVNFAAEPPGGWQRLFDLAAAADLRVRLQSPPGVDQAAEYLARWVEAFDAAAAT